MADSTSVQDRLAGLTREQRAALFEQVRKRKERREAAPERIPRRPLALQPPAPVPASFAQERLWFMDRLAPGNPAYTIAFPLHVAGPVAPDGLAAALGGVVARHEALRTTFAEEEGQPVQVITPEAALPGRFPLPVVDLARLAAPLRETEALRLAQEETERPFDLRKGPLLRALLVRLGAEEHALLLDIHHIVSDGWSMGVLVHELTALYGAALAGLPSPLPPLPIQYADFAVWQRGWLSGEVLERQIAYWRGQLAAAPASLDLPTDRPRPPAPSYRGERLETVFGVEVRRALEELARRHEASPYMVLLAAFQALLGRLSGQEDLIVGSPIANRNRKEIERLIGFFVNTLMMRGDLSGAPTFAELLGRVRQTALAAYAHQDLPFERLVAELRPERQLAVAPLFQVMCALQNAPLGDADLPGVRLSPLPVEARTVQFELELNAFERDEGLIALVSYSADLFDRTTVQRLAGHLGSLLAGALAEPERKIAELPLLAPAERQQLAAEWNDTARVEEAVGVVERFLAQVARTPEAVVLEAGGARLTYGELDRRAGRLAARLAREGVGPGVPVGLFAERSPELVIGIFAVWKAGGAYLPLDPGLPPARLAYLLEDSQVAIVLAPGRLATALPPHAARVVPLDGNDALEEGGPSPDRPPERSDLAYLIYTSGTTGRPKAVRVEHGHLASTLDAVTRVFGFAPGDRLPAIASFSFDIFLFELLGPLLAGGTVTLLPLRPTLDFERLFAELQTATLFHAVPAVMRQVVELARLRGGEQSPALRALFTGGDAVPADLLEDLRGTFPRARISVLYGPTEAAIVCTAWPVPETGPVRSLLGLPLPGAEIELLDRAGEPVPIGVPGEIWIGGSGVTRGYWQRPELTAERFVLRAGRRWFRSGDLARRLPDGSLEFLGRADQQVKVRGFRIELGEVEAQLLRHSAVRAAVAAVRDLPEGRGRQLVGYVVPRPIDEREGASAEATEHVVQWQELYDETYGREGKRDAAFDLEGWNSSYTGAPIPQDEMREWVERTVERILALPVEAPRRILEIGCGTGLLLFRLAPHAASYLGTDFSHAALDGIRRRLLTPGVELPQVSLRQATADDWRGVEPGAADLVILNSVVQYFPGVDYLLRVLAGAAAAVRPGGAVFVGDVRSRPLAEALAASVELFQAPDERDLAEIARRARRRVVDEEELVLDPRFFLALRRHLPGIGRVDLRLKRGRHHNELTRFRYDVVLHVGEEGGHAPLQSHDGSGLSLADVERLLSENPAPLVLSGLVNARLAGEAAALELLAEGGEAIGTAGELRRAVAGRVSGIDPEALAELAEGHGWEVELTVDPVDPFRFGARFFRDRNTPLLSSPHPHPHARPGGRDPIGSVLSRPAHSAPSPTTAFLPPGTGGGWRASEAPTSDLPLHSFANDPLAGKLARRLVPELRRFLAAELPDYMVPGAFVLLSELPVTAHGKVDRTALPEPEPAAARSGGSAPPATPAEQRLAELWREVLGIEEVSREDNFFALGGHSLLATQLVSRVRSVLGLDLPLRLVFERPVLSDLAAALAALAPAPLAPVARPGPAARASERIEAPLSFAQERLWFVDRLTGTTAYNLPLALALEGDLSPAALEAALAEIVLRHGSLRTTFEIAADADTPVQVVAPPAPWRLPQVDLAALGATVRAAEVDRLAAENAARPFDLTRGPLLRAALLRESAAAHILLVALHHIVSDGWSMGILVSEVVALYRAALARHPSPLQELPIQYADFAIWQRRWLAGAVLDEQLGYWREQLAGLPAELALPADRPRPARPSHRGDRLPFRVEPGLVQGLKELAAEVEATPFMGLLAVFQALLARSSGTDDVAVGSPIANRTRGEVEGLIGFFVNTLVLRARFDGAPSFRGLLRQVREATLGAYAHQDLPFERLVAELRPERQAAVPPLVQVLFALQNTPLGKDELPGLQLSLLPVETRTVQFDLEWNAFESADGGLDLLVSWSADLFDAATVRRLAGHFGTLLAAAVAGPGRRIAELPLLTPAERQQLSAEWNDTARTEVPGAVERFAAQVARTPEAVALEAGGERLTYGELDRRAGRLAARLRREDVGPGVPVGLCAERGLELVIGLLAIWKAGGAYLPLDPGLPPARLAYLLEDSRVSVVLASDTLAAALPDGEARVMSLDDPGAEAHAALPFPAPSDLAYLIYTSGTTGRPKAVAVEHGHLASTLDAVIRAFGFAPGDRLPAIASFSFDIFLFELLGPLATGGTVALLPLQPTLDFERLLDELQTATLFHAIPAAMRQVVELARLRGSETRPAPALRALFTGGDVVPADLLADLRALFPRAQLTVLYGPTEAAIVCTAFPVPATGEARSLLGRPLPGAEIELEDPAGEPVPIGVPGEIWIGGSGVARGYWHRPDLTAERFALRAGRRWFKSGDLARRLPDGTLEFLGRADQQVKVRGFRIELGEVEAQLRRHPAVRAAVAAVRDAPDGSRQLVAYVVLHPEAAVDGLDAELRRFLAAELPDYMVPGSFVPLAELPLTAQGKVDRDALPAPPAARSGGGSPPGTPAEQRLAALWRELLGVETVAREDHFFALGGHSLLATRLVSRVRSALGLDLPLRLVFERPVLSDLAAALSDLAAATGTEIPAPVPTPDVRQVGRIEAPLSFAQERLWFIDQLTGTAAYNLPLALSLAGDLSPAALEAALAEIVRRHGSLRTTFEIAGEGDDTPLQVVAPPAPWSLPRVDLTALPASVREGEVRRLAEENARHPFDLARGPLLRAALLRLAAAEHILLFTLHHIVSDGWSTGIVISEVVPLYRAALARRPSPLPELPIQYTDFARWQRQWLSGAVLDEQLGYWRERLAGAPSELPLPLDRPRPARQSHKGDRLALRLGPGSARGVKALGAAAEATPFMVLLAAFQALLARYTGEGDIAVGSPIANRTRREVEGLVGFFVNTLVLRTELSGVPSFRALLRRVREVTVGAYAHQDLPFERLVEELGPERSLSRNPLFQVMFTLENTPMGGLDLPGLYLAQVEAELPFAQFDLTLTLRELASGAGFAGDFEYSTDLFHRTTIARLSGHFRTLLAAALEAPERPLADLPLLSAAERAELFREWNDTRRDLPDLALDRLIAARAAAQPGVLAVVAAGSGEEVSYGELDRRSGRLAGRLRALGVGPESRVAISCPRSLDLVVAMLAVLKAGGAYVPLDPDYPAERVAWIRGDSGAALLLTPERLRELGDALPAEPLPPLDADPASAAYVIYTSGSTGRPKGVVVAQRSLSRYARIAAERYRLRPSDRPLQFSSLGFDTSADEIWCPLVAGATLVLRSEEMAGTIPRFLAGVERLGVTVLSLPTAFWHELALGLGEGASLPAAVRLAVVGGEEARPRSLLAWRFGLSRTRGSGGGGREVALLNGYGPTEATVAATLADLSVWEEGAPISLGRALDGVRLQVVDRDLQPVPAGVWGELLIGGAGVARGYLGRPETTAERFLPDAWGEEPGARVYRTGDLVRLGSDGALQWGRRIDRQVKVRGFRVEPGEVEAALADHPRLSGAAVVAKRAGDGDVLVAYVVAAAGAVAPAVAELRAFLAERLPDYMIPASFAVLAELPLTPHGKVDRRALARERGVGESSAASAGSRAALSPLEQQLARIWEEVLGVTRVGREDGFFALGGHSLAATRLVARLSTAFGVEVPLQAVFEAPTLAGMAERLGRLLPGATAATPVEPPLAAWQGKGRTVAPLSFAQERLWFVDRLRPGNTAFNMPAPLLLEGALDLTALDSACRAVRERQGSLRTRFSERAGVPVQVIDPPGAWSLPRVDLDGLPAPRARQEAERLAAEDAGRPFDLARGPLFRPLVARLGAEQHLLLLTCHHIVSDGWSSGVLLRELTASYIWFVKGGAGMPFLPDLPVQYADFAVWQRDRLSGPALDAEIDYWRGRLAGAEPLDLPADRPRRPVPSLRGGARPFRLDGASATALARLARNQKATLFMALQAGFAALLAQYTGRADLPIGTPVANRTRTELEGLIGFFVNTLVLRLDLAGDPDLPALLGRARETAVDAFAHQDLPFERLVDELDLPRDPYRPPLLRVLLQLETASREELNLPGLTLAPFGLALETAKFDLTVNLTELRDGVGGELRYDSDLFDGATIDRLSQHFSALLAAWAAAPGRPLSGLAVLSPAERHQLLAEWNDFPGSAGVSPALPQEPLHRRFEAQVDRAPDAVAVVAGGERLTYGELDRQANRIAHHLAAAGVRPGDRVALSFERSAAMIAAILGALKAGAAYVPLDPTHPTERLGFVRDDSGASFLLTAAGLEAARTASPRRPGLPIDPSFPAYVIYTSGSTGTPKGVVVSHANAGRLFTATHAWFGFGPSDTWTLFHSYAFDFSVWEIWGALLHGGQLVVVPYWESRSPEGFYRLLRDERVTVLNQTPSAFRQLLWAEEAVLGRARPDLALRWVIFGGEALEPAALAPWFARHGDQSPTLVNMYGITETTVHVTFRPLAAADLGRGSVLGRPIPDLSLHVLDPALAPLPIGVPGEIHVGGAGLAQGYLGRPELTAERFVPDPFSGALGARQIDSGAALGARQIDSGAALGARQIDSGAALGARQIDSGAALGARQIDSGAALGARLYRSGDLAKRLPDGDLESLGRIDHQVKIRGFRIELGEIEAGLARHPAVREAVVVAREDRLVAYLVPLPGEAPPPAVLRAHLATRLPEPMLPSAFVLLDALPRNANGKVDRRALPAAEQAVAARESAPPRTPLERFLAGQMRSVLGLSETDEIGVDDDFFTLGGSSISGALLVHRLQEALGEIVHVVTIFDHPTVARLAGYVRAEHAAAAKRLWGEGEAGGEAVSIVGPEEVEHMRRLIAAGRPEPSPEPPEPPAPPALFVLSPPRSGSTLLRVMLGAHPRLFAPPELELLSFRTLAERHTAFQGRESYWLEGLVRAVMEARQVDAASAERILAEAEREGWTTRRFYRELSGWLDGRMLVDKTPSYALDPEVLARAESGFAGARYLHLVRHPQATNRSFEEAKMEQIVFRRPHPFSRRQLAELVWTISHENILDFLATVPEERRRTVRFEELVREPERVLSGICDFLGIEYRPEMAEPYKPGTARMVDGPHAVSRMLGDVKFLGHGRVDAAVADRWRESAEAPLGVAAREVATELGYVSAVTRGVLVPLQAGAPGRRPLFCVHPVGGEVVAYRELARRLGPDEPVYGLQSPDPPLDDVRQMAALYLESVRAVQPAGPYRLLGWSMGGVVAYEMARQLAAMGEEVERLVLFDSFSPVVWAAEPALSDVGLGAAFGLDLARLSGAAIPEVDVSGLDLEGTLALVLDLARSSGVLAPGVGETEVRRLFDRFRANRHALATYPPLPYGGTVLLYRAADHLGGMDVPPDLGWSELVGDLRVAEVPGDHYSILRGPGAAVLAQALAPEAGAAG